MRIVTAVGLALVSAALSCKGSDAATPPVTAEAGDAGGGEDDMGGHWDPEIPPTGDSEITAWLESGNYRTWACEPAMHPAKLPSKNVMTRICWNAAMAGHASGPFPINAAAVEEVGDETGKLIGLSVQRKLTEGTTGANWYWYGRRFANDHPLADAVGSDATAKEQCVDCHTRAGADAGFGNDFVFTPAK